MFSFDDRTPFLRAIGQYLEHERRRPFSEAGRRTLEEAAALLADAESRTGLAFHEERPASVTETQLSDEVLGAHIHRFMDATCMVLDGHTAQLFAVVIDGAFEDDFLTARTWGGFVADWMNQRHPRVAKPWHYVDFYISNNCERVIDAYDEHVRAFVKAIELKNARSALA